MWAKSTARRMPVGLRSEELFESGPDRRGAGSIRAALRIFQMVDSARA
jgi:hypothetical protein